jgi:hypothetical protein
MYRFPRLISSLKPIIPSIPSQSIYQKKYMTTLVNNSSLSSFTSFSSSLPFNGIIRKEAENCYHIQLPSSLITIRGFKNPKSKQKSRRAAVKRFIKTGTGKLKRGHVGKVKFCFLLF